MIIFGRFLVGIEQYVGLTNDRREQLVGERLFGDTLEVFIQHDVTNSISQQYPKIAAALNALRHNPKPMESSTTTSADIQNGSISVVQFTFTFAFQFEHICFLKFNKEKYLIARSHHLIF